MEEECETSYQNKLIDQSHFEYENGIASSSPFNHDFPYSVKGNNRHMNRVVALNIENFKNNFYADFSKSYAQKCLMHFLNTFFSSLYSNQLLMLHNCFKLSAIMILQNK